MTYTSAQIGREHEHRRDRLEFRDLDDHVGRRRGGNTYAQAAPVARGTGLSQAIYYAKNIVASPAGLNTVTVTFDAAVPYADVRVTEYGGLDRPTRSMWALGRGSAPASASSGAVTTKRQGVAARGGMTNGAFTGRGNRLHDAHHHQPRRRHRRRPHRCKRSVGAYSATAPQNGTWVMQMVAFRAAGQ